MKRRGGFDFFVSNSFVGEAVLTSDFLQRRRETFVYVNDTREVGVSRSSQSSLVEHHFLIVFRSFV